MERILRHYFPHLSLQIDALRETCDSLPPESDSVARDDARETIIPDAPASPEIIIPNAPVSPETTPSAPASDWPSLEDENCTLDYLDGTTVRM
jgi:hypothetical protein